MTSKGNGLTKAETEFLTAGLNARVSPWDHGATTVGRCKAKGFVQAVVEETGGKRRTLYRTTDAGKTALYGALSEELEQAVKGGE